MGRRIDTLIEGGRVVAGGQVSEATVAIGDGTIVGVLSPGVPIAEAPARRIDATGKIVMPGVVDAHVHFGMFTAHVDDFASATTAAAHGGVTSVIIYAMGKPGMPPREFLAHWRREGESQSLVDFAMHCRLGAPDRRNTRQFTDAFDAGVTSFKIFMAYRNQGIMYDDYSLVEAMEFIGARQGIVCCHAENGDLCDYLEAKFQEQGRYSPETFLATRPSEAEVEATYRALTLARVARCPLYVVHMTTPAAIALVHQARLSGQPAWSETCPQYLALTQDDVVRHGGLAKIAPPLRTREERDGVWRAVMNGTVDVVGSDHAPYPFEMKSLPRERFLEARFGMPNVETMLGVLYSEGVATGRIDLPRMVRVLCEEPARVFGLAPRKGHIAVGADADLVIFDPDAEWRVERGDLHSRSGYSAYEGWTLRGKVASTIIRGEVVVQDGQLRQSPGFGRYLARTLGVEP
jgi:dihydropyrimidinase